MGRKYLRQIMDSKQMDLAMSGIATEILADHPDLDQTVLVGIRRRGVPLAEWLQKRIEKRSGKKPPLGVLDITFYRDDLSLVDVQPVVEESHLHFDVTDKNVILVDDVLYTGRTTRAALDSILDYGRPRRIQLAVLIDRGHRELPIQADYVGQLVETAGQEVVEVRIPPIDDGEGVFLTTKELLLKEQPK